MTISSPLMVRLAGRHGLLLSALVIAGCAGGAAPGEDATAVPGGARADETDDLPLGERPSDVKADGPGETWGSALTCKPIPELPALIAPKITVSLEGQTVHVVDVASGYDKVFPAGVGQINTDETDATFGESKSYYPIIGGGRQDFAISPKTVNACRTWWTDPDTHEQSPVFAGLPFMPFYGGYALHGPIDGFRAASGGTLRRGFVSHGCIRMQAADITELYARVKTLDSVPVHLQREPERLATGQRVDLASRWIGAECTVDADCNYAGGLCHPNPYGGRAFCTKRCTSGCPDRANLPETLCVADPADGKLGMCVNKVAPQNPDCRTYGEMTVHAGARINNPLVTADVCLPGSRGSTGDACLVDGDCRNGAICAGETATHAGVCSTACVTACADEPGFPLTRCAAAPASELARGCLRGCSPKANAPECTGNTSCARRDPTNGKDLSYVCRLNP